MQVFQESWQAKAEAKVTNMRSKIPKEWILKRADLEDAKKQKNLAGPYVEKFLHNSEVDIIQNDSVQLVEKIKSQHYTAVEVVQAYCKTAAVAQQIVTLHTAQMLDKHLKDNGTVKGPLHGLPISLKDQFHVKGYDTTMGYVGWIGAYEGDKDATKVHKVDSQIVKELLSLGAVFYCKTSLPQTLLAC